MNKGLVTPFWISQGKDVLNQDVCSDGTNTDFPCICPSDYYCCIKDSCDGICCRFVPEIEYCAVNPDGSQYCAKSKAEIYLKIRGWLNIWYLLWVIDM